MVPKESYTAKRNNCDHRKDNPQTKGQLLKHLIGSALKQFIPLLLICCVISLKLLRQLQDMFIHCTTARTPPLAAGKISAAVCTFHPLSLFPFPAPLPRQASLLSPHPSHRRRKNIVCAHIIVLCHDFIYKKHFLRVMRLIRLIKKGRIGMQKPCRAV